ncbi:MAG: dihydroorotate dehydrogenase electron transfer subunit [Tissierellia bacterium]|nr:dihydroorotate dehydrogenase electron transfer subunit [Tissierellia bacterium]
MAMILEHRKIDHKYYLLKVEDYKDIQCGQFYMVHSPNKSHLLGRPFSVYNSGENFVEFLYQVVGEGTKEITEMKKGEDIRIFGPYGNSFPYFQNKKIACIGGGVGIAPFYYYIKQMGEHNDITLYLGLNEGSEVERIFQDLDCNLVVQKGGFITDGVPYTKFDILLTCGPKVMMEKVVQGGQKAEKPVYISMEERMGCGFGGCLGCSIKTSRGNQRVCKDGPVFEGKDVFYESLGN